MEPSSTSVPARAEAEGAAPTPTGGGRLLGTLADLGPARVVALGLSAAGLIGFFLYLLFRVAEPHHALLYAGLDLRDSAEIVGRLEALGVPYRLQADGGTILVPADRALRLRMALAEDGLPRGGSVGYEIFDQASAFGTTNLLADINLRRALEGELARTIASLADVRTARVHLVLPKRELFRRETIEPSASVTLHMAGGRRLSRKQVSAIQHLTASAVPGLGPEAVTLVDDQGTLLARGGDDPEAILPAHAEEYRTAYEARLQRTIEDLLERSLGPGRVRAEVTADIDFDRVTTTQETFDPEGQVVRSTQTVEEESQLAEQDQDDAVSVANNLPNLGAEGGAAGRTSNENRARSEETTNYEISRTVRNHTQLGGRVRRLSVAVLVDGRVSRDAAGELVYRQLEADEIGQIETLVRSAVGFDAARGDVVQIINMPFAQAPLPEIQEPWLDFGLTKHDLMQLAELAILALVALLLITMVLRPAVRQLLAPAEPALAGAGAGGPTALPPTASLPALPGPEQPQAEAEEEELVDLGRVKGLVRADLIRQATSAVDSYPEEVVGILRSWLHET